MPRFTVGTPDGGEDWCPRTLGLQSELGTVWADCGLSSECGPLKKVLLHRPGREIEGITNPPQVLWFDIPDPKLAREQHDQMAQVYRQWGVEVLYVKDDQAAKPNLCFMRDPFAMTPQGAILSRLASTVRAGEERIAARALADNGIPILLYVHGEGTFEGPDLVFLDESLALIACGLRTSEVGAQQVAALLRDIGIDVLMVQTPYGCGHIDGELSIVDRRKAIVYPTRLSYTAYRTLKHLGYKIIDLPDQMEADTTMAINMVALAPGHVIMPAGNPITRKALEKNGVECTEVEISELMKGGGAVHCMTGVVKRDKI